MTLPKPAAATLTILGARGSIPVSGTAFFRYGGNTTSMALSIGHAVFAFIDAGTSLNSYRDHGLVLNPEVSVFLTHYHWDHIQGLSMLGEMWEGNCTIDIYGEGSPEDTLTRAISPPWFPVSLAGQSNLSFAGVEEPVEIDPLTISAFRINHPQGAVGYRIDGPNAGVAVITDHETVADETPELLAATRGVDIVIYDAQYLPGEMASHIGWGHSTWEDAVRFASDVGASRLILTSHDPRRTDDAIDAIVAAAREVFPNTEAAVPGLTIDL
jgi:phosphoribosyl 1,2-cyclic phosphodiesterase